ncbi:MAG: HlyD family efflux transporter periplasmic adaptor subunit, partial [Candidatus Promineifilaceae bacterium]
GCTWLLWDLRLSVRQKMEADCTLGKERNTTERDDGIPRARPRRSQEALDLRITFVPRAHKLLVAALMLVLASAMIWGWFGSIPTFARGDGIVLLGGQQMFVVEGTGSGAIAAISVKVGDKVAADQIVADVRQPDLEAAISLAEQQLSRSKRDQERTAARLEADLNVREKAAKQQLAQISKADGKFETEGQAQTTDLDLEAWRIRSALADFQTRVANELEADRRTVEEQTDKVARLKTQYDLSRYASAPVDGTVQEIFASIGQVVQPGDLLMTIAGDGEGFEVMAFLRAEYARRVEKGMPVHVAPSTVRQAEYGTMRGEVAFVSDLPTSAQAVDALLRNPELADAFTRGGAPYMSRIKLIEQPGNPSGFAWWSGPGPPFAVASGTLAKVDIVIGEHAPVTFVVPALADLLGR